MSDDFGRRPAINRETLRALQNRSGNSGGGYDGDGWAGKLSKPVLGLMAGFAVVGFLLATHVSAMKGFGRALDRHWAENVGYPGVEDAFKRSGNTDRWLERVHNDCKSRSDFVGRNRPKSHDDVLSSDGIIVGRSVAYVSCLAREQPQRLCTIAHRQHLLGAVKDYYRLLAKMREERVLSNAGPFAANRNVLMGPTRETIPTTSVMLLESDPSVAAALKALVVGGYLPGRDLLGATGGWPSDLELVLQGVEAKQKGCAG